MADPTQPVDRVESLVDLDVDWTGVAPDRSEIAPLDERTFVQRLQMLSGRARDLTALRKAFTSRVDDGQ